MKSGIIFWVLWILVVGACTQFLGSASNFQNAHLTQYSHEPIYISDNSEFNATNGVSGGNGTASDPYIISDLLIDAHGGAYGIYIEFTSAHFRIENCTVFNATGYVVSPYGCGIAFNSVSNGTITSCTIYANKYSGIWVKSSTDINISGNNVYNNTQNGILIANSDNVIVLENKVVTNGEAGILLQNAMDIIVQNNTLTKNDIQISGEEVRYWETHTIDNNLVNGKPAVYIKEQSNLTLSADYGQIIIGNSTFINITGITIKNSSIGVQVGFSSNVQIKNSKLSENNLYGIYTYRSTSLSILNCTITANGKHGVFADSSIALAIHQCYIANNQGNGIHFMETQTSSITENEFVGNANYGIYITFGSISNEIHHNDFSGNNGVRATSQAYDSTGGNTWCPDNYGNFWSDWQAPDADGNFVVDAPYQLDGTAGVKDDFPLVNPQNHIWIYHTPIKYVDENSEIKVNAVVHTIASVSSVELKYIPLQSEQYVSMQMSRISGNETEGTYVATIPAQNGTGYLKYYITASVGGSTTRTPEYVCIVGELDMSVNISLSRTEIAPGENTTVTVSVKNAITHGVLAGAEVSLSVSGLSGMFDKEKGNTDNNGIFVANFTASNTSSGGTGKIIANVSAAGYKHRSAEVFLTISSGGSLHELSVTISLSSTQIVAGNSTTVTVLVKNASSGEPVANAQVSMIAENVHGTFEHQTGYTNSNGMFVTTFTPDEVANNTTGIIIANVNASGYNTGNAQKSITVYPSWTLLHALSVNVEVSSAELKAGESIIITVTVVDEKSETVFGANVSIEIIPPVGLLDATSKTTDNSGHVTFLFTAKSDIDKDTVVSLKVSATKTGYTDAEKSLTISVRKKVEPKPTPGFEMLLVCAAAGAGVIYQMQKKGRKNT
ncbi:MAG: right-handed parallel beta-helix repeat-containing protein [Thermoplasmata archaeon]